MQPNPLINRIRAKVGGFIGGAFYEAANWWSPDRSYIQPYAQDSDQTETPYNRLTLLGKARVLYGNFGFVRGAIDDLARYSVGDGIFPHSAAADKSIREAHDAYWEMWCNIPEVRQTLTFGEILKEVSKALDIDGDVGFILTETETGYPQIQAVLGHRIESDPEKQNLIDGIKLNNVGRPVAYSIRIKGKEADRYVTYPASSFVHVFDPERMDSSRGISSLTHGINTIIDWKDIIDAEKLGVKLASAHAIAVTRKSMPALPGRGFYSSKTIGGTTAGGDTQWLEAVRKGMILQFVNGESVEVISSNRPSPTFTGFIDHLAREVAVGLGVPVEFVWDSSKVGGVTQRFILKKAEKRFKERQEILAKFIRRVRAYVIAKGIKRGDIPISEDFWKVDFQFPSLITVDVGREAEADRKDIIAGIRTEQENCREQGKRWETQRDRIQEAADDIIRRGLEIVARYEGKITLEAAIALMQQRGSGGSSATAIEPETQKAA